MKRSTNQKKTARAIVRFLLCTFVMLGLTFTNAKAQFVNIPCTGYNADLVANGAAGAATAQTSTTTDLDGLGAGYGFVDGTFNCGLGAPTTGILPASGLISSTAAVGLTYTLQGYSSNNALRVPLSGTGIGNATLTPVTPFQSSNLYLLSVSGGGAITSGVTVTVTFSDASAQVFSNLTTGDWCNTTAGTNTGGVTYTKITTTLYNRVARTATCSAVGTCQYFAEFSLPLSTSNYGKLISSINISKTTSGQIMSVFAVGATPLCATPSAQATSLIQGATATGSISASFTAATGAPTGYLVVRYPNLASTTAPVNGNTYVTGQSIGLGTVVQAGATTSFTATGLSGATSYDFYVYSYNTGATCGGPIYLGSSPLTATYTTSACGSMSGTINIDAGLPNTYPGGFTSITNALTYINTNGLGGNTILELQPTYNPAGETYPITFPANACVNSSRTLTIRPAAGVGSAFVWTSALTSETVLFNGATYVTIDGRNGGTGTNQFIRIVNTSSTAGAAGNAVLMQNESSNNTITYVDLQASNLNPAINTGTVTVGAVPGVVAILSTAGINGNDNNTISFCNIHAATSVGNVLNVGVYAYNATAVGNLANNDNNTITNCNIYDMFNATTATAAIDVVTGNNNWNITNNSVYQTASRTYTTALIAYRGFWITPGASAVGSSGFTIIGNYIGGTAPLCGSTPYTMLGATTNTFFPMDISVGTLSATNVNNNTIQNIAFTTQSVIIYFGAITVASGNVNVGNTLGTGNTIGSGTGNGSITLNNSTTSNATSVAYGIRFGGGAVSIANYNTIGSITINNAAISNSFIGIGMFGGGTTSATMNNNLIGSLTTANSIQFTGVGATATAMGMCGIFVSSGPIVSTINNNVIANLNNTYTGTTTTTTLTVRGIDVAVGANTISGNIVRNLTSASLIASSGSTANILGIVMRSTTAPSTVTSNQIYSLKLTSTSTTVGTQITGIYWGPTTSGTNLLAKNFIHSFDVAYTTTTSTTATFTGVDVGAGVANIQNNYIRLGINDAGASVTTPLVIRGFSVGTTSTTNLYYNTVYIGGTGVTATSAANHSSAFNRSAVSGALVMRNNIFANTRTNVGSGQTNKHYSVRLGTATAGCDFNYNNYYYSAGNDNSFGLNNATAVPTYSLGWLTGDNFSQVGNPQFLVPNGTASTVDLHLNTAVAGVAEGAGVALAGIVDDDYDGNTRQGSTGYVGTANAPDLGADEYAGVSAIPVFNSLVNSPSGIQCSSSAHTITTTINSVSGSTITAVTLNYSINGAGQTGIAMTLGSGAANSTSVWTGTIPIPTPANATIVWYVTATDGTFSNSQFGTSYSDVPLLGASAIASVSVNPICAGSSTNLSVVTAKSGSGAIGAGGTTSATYPNPIYSNWANQKMQILYLASELTSAGFVAGNITSMALNLTSTSVTSRTAFTINIAPTTATALTTTYLTPTFTQVYTGNYVPAVGTNSFPFGTGAGSSSSFNWNGTSNIVIQICWDNTASTATEASTCTADNTAFASVVSYNRTSTTGTPICGLTVTGALTYTVRPTLTFVGNKTQALSSYSWFDGSTVVGTSNPLAVSPVVNTSYTVTATHSSGCTLTATTSVTAITLPTTPTASNSSQCGAGLPTASVASTSGAPTPTFNWYSVPTGGTALQSSTSTTYTTSINTTSTFYVAEASGACESPRVTVTVNVSQPDPIVATASASPICVNTPVTLGYTQALSNNIYSVFSWSGLSGSGASTPVSGSPAVITPTVAGTYTYTITASEPSSSCATISTIAVTVTAGPNINTPVASPSTVCSGSPSTLTATTNVIGSGSAQVGAGTTTVSAGSYLPYYRTFEGSHAQYLYTASELTALGFFPGNMTSLTIPVSVVSATPFNFDNFGIRMANTLVTSLTAFQTPTYTNVYSASTTTPIVGNNTYTFSTPFSWDGTSNVLIDIYHDNDPNNTCTAGSPTCWGNSATESYTTTAFTSVVYYYADNTTGARTMSSLTTATGSVTTRPNFILGGQFGTVGAGSLTWTWNPGSINGNSVSVSPLSTTTYTVSANGGACTSTLSVTVNVIQLPSTPTATNTAQCGSGVPTASVASTSGAPTPTFKWYSVLTGGTALQTSTSTTYTTSIGSTATFYISEVGGSCESQRVPVTITVTQPDAIVATASATTFCVNSPITLNYTQALSNNVYSVISWSGAAGSGASTPVAGNPAVVTPSLAGPYTYTITASEPSSGCATTATIAVTATPGPTINTPVASPSTVCSGSPSTLTATTNVIGAGVATVGAGATTSATYSNPFYSLWSNTHMQHLVLASELTASGLYAGNITSLGLNITVPSTLPMLDLSVKIGHTSATNMSSYVSTTFTTVYTNASLMPITGVNTMTFSTPFVWDGVSNIVIEICHGNSASTATMSRTCLFDNTAYVSTIHTHKTVGTAGTAQCSDNTTNVTTYSGRPQFIFNGQVLTTGAGSGITWNWNPGSLSGNSVSVSPTSTTTYTVSANGGACTSTSSVVVNVNPLIAAPSATNATQCGTGIPTVSVASTSGGSGNGQFSWYNASTGGTLQQAPASAMGTYYSNNFSSGANGGSLSGSAAISGGVIALQPTTTATGGAFTVNASGTNSNQYQTDFDLSAISTGTSMADGFSYCIGDDAIPLNNSSTPTAEHGSGSKIRIAFLTYNAASGSDGKGIYLLYNSSLTTGYTSGGTGVLGYSTNVAWIPTTATTVNSHVTVTINSSGQLTLSVGGTAIFTNVQLPAGYLSSDRSTWKHIFSSRSGGITGGFSMDNLVIQQLVPSAGYSTYLSSINTTTTWYVSEMGNNGCPSPRTAVTETVNTPNPIVATASATPICVNTPVTLNYTQALSNNTYDNISWAGAAGSGASTPVTVNPAVISPTVGGTYTYTVTASETSSGCVTTSSVAVVVTPGPVINTPTAVPSSVCAGVPSTLTATTNVINTGSLTVGTGTTTSAGGSFLPYYRTFEGSHKQYLYTASELSALGLFPGNITSLTIPVSVVSASPFNFDNFGIRMANTSAISLTAFQTPTFTNVYNTSSTTPIVGNNTYAFSAPFAWDGTSNVLLDVYYDNDPGNTCSAGSPTCWGNSATEAYSTTGFTSVVYYYADNTSGARTMSSLTTVSGSAATRPNFVFSGQVGTVGAGTVTWTWNPGSLNGNTVTVNPLTTTTYTVSANGGGCISTSSVAVNVTPLPSVPTATNSIQCGAGIPTASVTSTSGAPTPIFKWYNAATGGTVLQTGTSTTYTTSISLATTFYVSELSGTCESSPRTAVLADNSADVLTIVGNSASCLGTPNAYSITQTGSNQTFTGYTWSATPATGSGITGTVTGLSQTITPTANGVYTYSVVATSGTCNVTATKTVSIYTGLSGTATSTPITSCVNPTGLITANVNGAGTIVNNDFTSSVLPSNMVAAGNNFAITGGRMQLTSAANSMNGGVLITNTTGLANNDFQIDFDMITTTSGSSPADGFSYSYGDDVVALPDATAATGTSGVTTLAPENGSGTKLKLSFDAISNTGGCTGGLPASNSSGNTPGVYLMYNCTASHQGPTCNGVVYYDGGTTVPTYTNGIAGANGTVAGLGWRATTTSGATTHVTIKINALGQVSMWLNASQVVTNQQLPASYLTANKSTWKHAFCARTGGLNEGHYIDNLLIQYNNFYEYSINGGSSWTTNNPIIPPSSGTYSVDARYVAVPACSANLGSVTIATPIFTTGTTLATVCSGTATQPTLSFSPTFGSGATYQWESSPVGANTWSPISGATSATYTPTIALTASMDFHCVISCGGTPVAGSPSSTQTIVVTPTPTASASSNTGICATQTLDLTGTTDIGTTFSWTGPNGFTSASQSPSIVGITTSGTGTYSFTASNSGCSATGTTVVIINPAVTMNSVTATPAVVCNGSNSVLTANASLPPLVGPNGYNRIALSGQTFSALSGTGITTINTTAQLTAGMGSASQDDGGVVVTLPFTFSYMGNTFTQMSMCTNGWVGAGNQSTIDAVSMRTAGNLFTTTIPNNTIAAWFKDMGANFPTGTGSMRYGSIGTDVYAFQWNNAVGSGFSDGSAITISFQVNIYGPASTNPGRIEIVYGPTAGTITTAASIGIEDATGGTNHYINALDGTQTSTTTSSAWPGNGNGYRFDPIVQSVSNYTWSADPTLSVTAGSTVTASSVTLPTTYSVTASSTSGCTATGTVSVTVNPLPTASISGTTSVCAAGGAGTNVTSANLIVDFTGVGPWHYSVNGVTQPVANTSPATVTVNPTTTTTYSITSFSDANCTGDVIGSGSAVVTVKPLPDVQYSVPSASICSGLPSNVALSSSVSGATYTWFESNNSGIVSGTSPISSGATIDDVLSNTTNTTVGTIKYTVTPTADGCTSNASLTPTISVKPTPVGVSTPSSDIVCDGYAPTFDLTTGAPGINTFAWSASGTAGT